MRRGGEDRARRRLRAARATRSLPAASDRTPVGGVSRPWTRRCAIREPRQTRDHRRPDGGRASSSALLVGGGHGMIWCGDGRRSHDVAGASYRVSVTKDYLVFASAHFITFAGHRCEGLHGHNYRVRVTIEGALNEESLVRVRLRRAEGHHEAAVRRDRSPGAAAARERSRQGGRGRRRRHASASTASRATCFRAATARCCRFPNTTVEMLAKLLTDRLKDCIGAEASQPAHGHRDGSRGELRADRGVSGDADVGPVGPTELAKA